MQRLMEENGMIAESKIRALRTENEALRLHLKLAVESLRHPIALEEQQFEGDEEEEEEDFSGETVFDEDEVVSMQMQMEGLLRDVGVVREKMRDDWERFGREEGEQMSVGRIHEGE
ncbi:Kinesin [Ascosphaera atra]|nr:Kinesin [Ascosphaera atra]